ncbi:MAG: hypothetical protein COT26_01820 [Candidatus Kerfeldbacteria bacterium CG08_land_8_20_14_0_20_43_14]|uniref:Uncharacterized protein n=1 Tax=Candidatus Kerfeldbacteria bacterium CG08_land_8_20_14_0_20_43_14 TaxID=2014246 RepID=A0A2H0YSI0_9BACT|nr:MAG: hypothetical protein COT26_01820 [Candidatus Kerfeldbacteria bacterium CG08_land_8_20_14_0_20_43_14]
MSEIRDFLLAFACVFAGMFLQSKMPLFSVKAVEQEKAAQVGERQLLQMLVSASKHYDSGDLYYDSATLYYPDDNLDCSVYRYAFNKENGSIMAIADDSTLVPKGKEIVAHGLKSGLPVRH